jgi:hypothetical protein
MMGHEDGVDFTKVSMKNVEGIFERSLFMSASFLHVEKTKEEQLLAEVYK